MIRFGAPVPGSPDPLGMETFDPYQEPSLATAAAFYGGQPWCPIDPDGNNLCICADTA
jgi:hypothetical protein